MKKFTILMIAILNCLVIEATWSQALNNSIRLGIFNNPVNSNTLEIRILPTRDVPLPSSPLVRNYTAGVFTVRCLHTLGVTSLTVSNSAYQYVEGNLGTDGAYDYFSFQFSGNGFAVDWPKNIEVIIAKLQFTITNPSSTFEFELVTGDAWTGPNGGNYYQEVYGNDAQKDFYEPIAAFIAALLPVEWLTFKASPINTSTGTKVALDWSTASEKNVKNYEIERSEDGKGFKKIGKEQTASNTLGNHSYSALDEKPVSGVSYYRIRQTDYDGKTSITKIQSVNLSNQKSKGKFTFYPNPIQKGTPLSILTDVQGEYSFKVIDLTGKIIYNAKLQGNAELKNMTLAGGTYLYEILSGDQHISGKIFVAE